MLLRSPRRCLLPFALTSLVLIASGCRRQATAPAAPAPSAKAPASDARSAVAPAPADAVAGVPLPVAAPTAPPAGLPPGHTVTILYSSNLRGEYEAHPLGGLARRASYTRPRPSRNQGRRAR